MFVRQSLGTGAPEPSLGLQGREEGGGNEGGVKLTKTRCEQPQGTHYSKASPANHLQEDLQLEQSFAVTGLQGSNPAPFQAEFDLFHFSFSDSQSFLASSYAQTFKNRK